MPRPNILIIMCDQLNASVLSCYGGPVLTPNIDGLAESGARFTAAYCPTPFCSPSRASMITGLYPHAHGITGNVNRRDYPAIPAPATEEGLRAGDVATEGLLHAAGYATHHYGKWHLMDDDLPYYADMFGEHHAYAALMAGRFAQVREMPREQWVDWYGWSLPTTRSEPLRLAAEALGNRWDAARHKEFLTKMGRLDLPLEETFDYMVASRAAQAIAAAGGSPFMITCSFNWPHDPNVVPSPYYEMFDPDEIELPGNWHARERRHDGQWSRQVVADLGEAGAREFMRVYYAMVKLVDDQVGRVLDALDRSGRADDTIVLFTADHGDMCGGHGMVWKSTDAFYEEVARVPFLMRYPRAIDAGQVPGAPCSLVNVMPTLLELAEHVVPPAIHGRSLAPLLHGEADHGDQVVFSERIPVNAAHTRRPVRVDQGSYMIRQGDWKYCRYADGDEVLFNLRDDPAEVSNLAANPAHRGAVDSLRQRLEAFLL